MKYEEAYWISPHSEIIPVEISHIQKVFEFPERFKLSKEYLRRKYKQYNEKIGIEGKAREEIMTKLINYGWIRIRLKNRPDYWIIQVQSYSEQTVKSIKKWIKMMNKNKFASKYDEIRIYQFEEAAPITLLFGKK